MTTLLTLLGLLLYTMAGGYCAYRLIDWFETGRTEAEPFIRANVRRVK